MKQITKKIETNISKLGVFILFISVGFFFSCEDNILPEAGSIADKTPPKAGFSASVSNGDWQTYDFSNQSVSSTDFVWEFGDGSSSTDKEPSHKYAAEGAYTVSLKATDKLGVSSSFSNTVTVVKPIVAVTLVPEILEAGFDNGNDSRDPWRNGDLGGVIQITSSPVESGSNAAKFPSAGDRVAYQELEVSPNADYTLTYWYTIKTSPAGSITVAVLAGDSFKDITAIPAATIASFVGTDQTSASDYVKVDLKFNSGNNSKISILASNQGAEARIDSFSIVAD